MGKFLVIATGPLLDEEATRLVSGQCLRTMHFVNPMQSAGHEVRLATVPIPGTDDPHDRKSKVRRYRERVKYKAFSTADEQHIVRLLTRTLENNKFDGVVGVNAYPAFLLAKAQPKVPFWADLNGWTMAEGQTRGALVGHDRDLDHFWRLEVEVLLAADRLSTVSDRQADALYGELALVGRLNRHTFDWNFASAVPNAIYPLYNELPRSRQVPAELADKVPGDAPVALWSGGFNTWTDVNLLVEGLAKAMAETPSLHFVATGGAVFGHDDDTYARFQKLAAARLEPSRTHILGWVGTPLVLALHARADVGINIDSLNTETRFGARNRLTNMLGAGVPILTTRGTEIAAWIERHGAGSVFAPGDVDAFAAQLTDAAVNRAAWEARAVQAREAARAAFAPAQTLTEFLRWCAAPRHAPDRQAALTRKGRAASKGPEELEARLWARLKLDGQVRPLLEDRASLAALRAKWPLSLWRSIKKIGTRE